MTIVITLIDGSDVYMGADRGCTENDRLLITRESKINIVPYQTGTMLVASSGLRKVNSLIAGIDLSGISPIVDAPGGGSTPWIVQHFLERLRERMIASHHEVFPLISKDERDLDAWILIAAEGRVFRADPILDIAELSLPYAAIGCASDIALGAMFVAEIHKTETLAEPSQRIRLVLDACERHHQLIQGPFDIEHIHSVPVVHSTFDNHDHPS